LQDERSAFLATLAELEATNKAYLHELQQYKDCDPEILKRKEKSGREALDHANRWTDNIFSVKSYCVNQFGMESAAFDQSFGIPEDFDSVEA
jgi:hypothetical protein